MKIHGNKTYATAAMTIAAAWIAFIFDADLGDGPVSLEDAIMVTAGGLLAAFVRHGVATGARSTAAAAVLAAIVVAGPGCSTFQALEPGERTAKLRYSDALEAVTAAKRTTARLYQAGIIDAEAVVTIDAIIVTADERLESAWARIEAGVYDAQTLDLIDFVFEATERVAALQIELENPNGRDAASRHRLDGPRAHHQDHRLGRAEPGAGRAVRRAA